MKKLFEFLAAIALVSVVVIANGAVLSVLWEWFIVGLGVKSISISESIGFALVVSFVTYRYQEPSKTSMWHQIAVASVRPAVALAFGCAVHLFV